MLKQQRAHARLPAFAELRRFLRRGVAVQALLHQRESLRREGYGLQLRRDIDSLSGIGSREAYLFGDSG